MYMQRTQVVALKERPNGNFKRILREIQKLVILDIFQDFNTCQWLKMNPYKKQDLK